MRIDTYGFVLKAREPIAHSGRTSGNMQLLQRSGVMQPDGTFEEVPRITGTTMRHHLRTAATAVTLDAAGMWPPTGIDNEGAIRLLFNGGTLGGKSAGGATAVKLDEYRRMIEAFPPLALFGGNTQNRINPGSIRVGEPLMICAESANDVDLWALAYAVGGEGGCESVEAGEAALRVAPHSAEGLALRRRLVAATRSCSDAVELETRHARDVLTTRVGQMMLSDEARGRVERRMIEHESASAAGDSRTMTETRSSQTIYSYERARRGTLWWWTVRATTYTDVERDCFVATLATALAFLAVGGKQGDGNGHLEPVFSTRGRVERPLDVLTRVNARNVAETEDNTYRHHVEAHADDLRSFMAAVKA